MSIENKVREIVCHYLEADPQKVSKETFFVDDLKADSLALTELVLALDDQFEIDIDGEDVENLNTFGSAVKHIEAKVSAGI